MRTEEHHRTVPSNWGIIGIAVAAGIVTAMQVGKVPPVLSVMRQDMGLSLVTAGWVASLFNGCGAVFGIVAGVMADRIGAHRILIGCVILLILGSLLGAIAPTVGLLFVSRFIEGVGYVGLIVAAPAIIVAASVPQDRRLALGVWGIYMPMGMALALVGSPFLLRSMSWRGIWLVNAAILVTYLLALLGGLRYYGWPDTRGTGRQVLSSGLNSMLRNPGIWVLAACFSLYSLQFFAVMTWLPTMLIERIGWPDAAAAYATALVVFVNVFGNLIAASLMRRGTGGWILIATAYFIMAATAVGVFAGFIPVRLKIPLAIVFSLTGGLLPAAVLAGVPAMAKSATQVSTANGIVVQGTTCGSLVGPPVMAVAVKVFGGWQNVYWLMIICCCIGVGFAFSLRRMESPDDSPRKGQFINA